MPSAWTQNYYHTVFSTKQRHPWITPDIEDRLYPFVAGILRDLRCAPIAVNGMPDHVHVLARYRADLSHADMLRHVKSRSSKWIHESFPNLRDFAWQEGYGGFTVSRSALDAVEHYITNQKEHHRTMDFKTEFLSLLQRHAVEHDPRDLFD